MYKSNLASKLLKGDYWVLTRPLSYLENGTTSGFSLYIPPGYLIEKPYLPFWLRVLTPSKYEDCAIMYIYMLETRTIFHNKKPVAIEKKGCDIIFLDMLEKKGLTRLYISLVRLSLKFFRATKQNSPVYLLRKNAVEFYIRKKAKMDGYYS